MNNQEFKSIMDKEGSVGIGGESITPYPYRLNTDTLEKINIGLDYLNLNFPMNYPQEIDKLNEVLKVLRLDTMEYEEIISRSKSSKKVLRECHRYTDSTSIFINDSVSNDRPLTRIELKGQGCRELEGRYLEDYETGYYNLLYKTFLDLSGWCTRFDIFIDCINGDITTKELDYKIQNCEYTSVFRKVRFDGTRNCKDYSEDGWGYIFGTEGSGTRLRIYDKLAEQIAKGKSINPNVKSWIRYEIRFYHDVAKTMSQELLINLSKLQNYALELLKGIIDFKEPSLALNKSEWKTWRKWKEFLGDIQGVKPHNQFKKESTLQVTKRWYSRSATKALEQSKLIMTPEEAEIERLQNEYIGLNKITQSVLNQINQERELKGLSKLYMKDIEDKIKQVVEELKQYNIYIENKEAIDWARDIFGDVLQVL